MAQRPLALAAALALATVAAEPRRAYVREDDRPADAHPRERRLWDHDGGGGGGWHRRYWQQQPVYPVPPIYYPPGGVYPPPVVNPPIVNPPFFPPPITGGGGLVTGGRALITWFASPLCNQNTIGGGTSLVLVTAGVCNVVPAGAVASTSYQVLCRADRTGGVIRFCANPSCGGCTEVPFNNNGCLINLPGLGAQSYWITCAPPGPLYTSAGSLVSDATLTPVTVTTVLAPGVNVYPGFRRLEESEGAREEAPHSADGGLAEGGAAAAADVAAASTAGGGDDAAWAPAA